MFRPCLALTFAWIEVTVLVPTFGDRASYTILEDPMTLNVEIFTRNMEIDEAIRDYVSKRAARLDRYLPELDTARLDLAYLKSARSANDRYVAQITVRGGRALLRTEERADNIRSAFDSALEKLERQIDRYKGKHRRGRGDGRSAAEVVPVPQEEVEETPVIARRKTFSLIPMNEAEALEQMKLLGHDNFFIFYNVETNAINVLYRRRDGTSGLIEPTIG
jgi:putative sigma-54 modulation protein